jgi:hypothetical protein
VHGNGVCAVGKAAEECAISNFPLMPLVWAKLCGQDNSGPEGMDKKDRHLRVANTRMRATLGAHLGDIVDEHAPKPPFSQSELILTPCMGQHTNHLVSSQRRPHHNKREHSLQTALWCSSAAGTGLFADASGRTVQTACELHDLCHKPLYSNLDQIFAILFGIWAGGQVRLSHSASFTGTCLLFCDS